MMQTPEAHGTETSVATATPHMASTASSKEAHQHPYGQRYPRWTLLGLITLNGATLLGLGLAAIERSQPACTLGFFCTIADTPAWLQFGGVWGSFLLIAGLYLLQARRVEYAPSDEREDQPVPFIREISNFGVLDGTLRLMAIEHGLLLLLLFVTGHGSGFVYGLLTIQILTTLHVSLWLSRRRQRINALTPHPLPPVPAQHASEGGAFLPGTTVMDTITADLVYLSTITGQEIAAHLLMRATPEPRARQSIEAEAHRMLREDLALLIEAQVISGIHIVLYEPEFDQQHAAYRVMYHAAYMIERPTLSGAEAHRSGLQIDRMPLANWERKRLAMLVDFTNDAARQRAQSLPGLQLSWNAHDGPFDASVVYADGATLLELESARAQRHILIH